MYQIPPNATRIRYLDTNGSGAYIDTGIVPHDNPSAVLVAQYGGTNLGTSQNLIPFGVRNNTASQRFAFWINSGTNKLAVNYATTDTGWQNQTTDTTSSHEFKIDNNGGYFDGTKFVSYSLSISNEIGQSVYVGALNDWNGSSSPQTRGLILKIFRFKLWCNGELVFDGIPVRVGQVGYLFDRVSGQLFGNAGTGDFVLGPDTFQQGVVPTRMMAMGVRKKPYDAEVEYIESTGTQYVDTGVLKEPNTIVSARIYSAFPAQQQFFGTFAASRRFSVQVNTNLSCYPYSGTGISTTFKTTKNEWHDYSVDSGTGTYSFDGTSGSIAGAASFSTTIPIFVFCRNQSGVVNTLSAFRLASLSISHGTTSVRDFQPVRVGQVGYLYDRANPTGGPLGNGLYGSATGTPLIAGPDKIPS